MLTEDLLEADPVTDVMPQADDAALETADAESRPPVFCLPMLDRIRTSD